MLQPAAVLGIELNVIEVETFLMELERFHGALVSNGSRKLTVLLWVHTGVARAHSGEIGQNWSSSVKIGQIGLADQFWISLGMAKLPGCRSLARDHRAYILRVLFLL
jgi:hypothetical protein